MTNSTYDLPAGTLSLRKSRTTLVLFELSDADRRERDTRKHLTGASLALVFFQN